MPPGQRDPRPRRMRSSPSARSGASTHWMPRQIWSLKMPLLPDEVATKTFAHRLWRGYDRSQVDGFLQRVAADYAGAIDRIATLAEDRTAARARVDELLGRLDAAKSPLSRLRIGRVGTPTPTPR